MTEKGIQAIAELSYQAANAEAVHRVAVFIDGSNLYHALEQSCGRTDLDFPAFIQWLAYGRPVFRTYYYNVLQDEKRRPNEHRDQQRFLQALYQIPYLETRFGMVRFREGIMVEKGVDIMLATDILQYAWKGFYDVAVLVSGDGDFAYALQTVKNLGKYVQVVCFESNQSPELWQIADERILITPDLLKRENLWVSKPMEPMSAPVGGLKPARRRRRRAPVRPKAPGEQPAVSIDGNVSPGSGSIPTPSISPGDFLS